MHQIQKVFLKFSNKKRDKDKPLICLLSHFNQLKHYIDPPTQKVREKLNLNTDPP